MSNETILDTMGNTNEFTKFLFLIKKTGLEFQFTEGGPYTLLAPYDEAFLKLGDAEVTEFIENLEFARNLLKYHLIRGLFTISDLVNFDEIQTVQGGNIRAAKINGIYKVNECSEILRGDINSGNGIIHIIDNVLIPDITYE